MPAPFDEAATPEGPGQEVMIGNGSPAKVFYVTEDGPRTPSEIVPIRRGFDNVNHMLSTPGFTWGHRGNSTRYSEMSMHAYTQTVARGYGVLEVSLGRTSDGVWFGLHDETLDRTSLLTGNVKASDLTWDEVQQYQILLNQDGLAQPYVRWEEIVSAYGDSHILVVDPKHEYGKPGRMDEFYALMNSTLDRDRAIMAHTLTSLEFVNLANQHGYASWGYTSEEYLTDPNVAARAPLWTMVGLDINASQESWYQVIGFGKPVVGHVATSQAMYDSAMSKGAAGVQCAASHLITAVGPQN